MRAPGFWAKGHGRPLSTLLSPIGMVYGYGTLLRQSLRKSWCSPVPVICVGNLIAGGAGKTPVVMDIARRMVGRGVTPHLISRGYGGTEKGPLRVSKDRYDARLVGDEPLLLSGVAPTWVSDDRRAACRAALVEGAMCMILDDGFQDPSVHKNISLVVVDGDYGFGNGNMIPAGPLREPVSQGLARADAVILMGKDTTGVADQVAGRCPIIQARLEAGPDAKGLDDQSIYAFAGIGRPEKFFHTLEQMNCEVMKTKAFADHHNYTRAELDTLRKTALAEGLTLVTTEKDWVRIPPESRDGIEVLAVNLAWENESEIDSLLEPVISNAL